MNPSFVTSFVIGGLMLLSILAFNMNLSSSTQETVLTTVVQERMNSLVEVLSYDFNNIGYNPSSSIFDNDFFSITEEDDIRFEASALGNVRWEWKTTGGNSVTSTSNPNDYYLVRTNESGNQTNYPVTYFNLKYFNSAGNPVANPESLPSHNGIRIEVEIIMESGEPTNKNNQSSSAKYHRTVWKKMFIPNNINKPW